MRRVQNEKSPKVGQRAATIGSCGFWNQSQDTFHNRRYVLFSRINAHKRAALATTVKERAWRLHYNYTAETPDSGENMGSDPKKFRIAALGDTHVNKNSQGVFQPIFS